MTMHKRSLSYHDYVQGLQMLTPEEQFRLLEVILANLKFVMQKKQGITTSKLRKLKPRRLIVGDPDELVNLKVWEWNEQHNL